MTVPAEVMEFAAPLAASVSPSTAFPVSVRPPADGALTVVATGRQRLVAEAVSRALGLAMLDGEQARSVVMITPDDETLLDQVRKEVSAAQESALPGIGRQITVLPARMAKGLEFDHVLVLEPRQIAEQGPAGPRRLYVAITRCTQTLTVLHSTPLPAELGGPVRTPSGRAAKITPVPGPSATAASERYESRDDFLTSLKKRVHADRRDHVHERLRHSLIAELFGARLQPSGDLPFSDVVCRSDHGAVLYEIVSKVTGTYPELRDAAVRMPETERAGGERADHLFLVLPGAPQDLWALDLLVETFNVSVIWKTGAGWDGTGLEIALGKAV
ncbi:hypothetical protein [Streptosporangium sp. NPDC048865]|uniref:hypothetical protein n=1 Tax=Streptosporangium sp. NPDC048865 TaxID=3155766 RepID=UPI0034461BC9